VKTEKANQAVGRQMAFRNNW